MKKYYTLFFYLLFLKNSFYAQENDDKHIHYYYGPVSQTHVHTASQSTCSTKNDVEQKVDQNQAVEQEQEVNVEQKSIVSQDVVVEYLQEFRDFRDSTKKQLNDLFKDAKQYIFDNKWYIVGATVVIVYGTIHYVLWKSKKYVENDGLWCHWKPLLSFEQLLAVPHNELEKELLKDIQSCYINRAKPNDFLFSLISFIQDIDNEINQLQFYRRYYSWLYRSYCKKIFFINLNFLDSLSVKIKKLLFIKNIFSSLVSHYKINQFQLSCVSKS